MKFKVAAAPFLGVCEDAIKPHTLIYLSPHEGFLWIWAQSCNPLAWYDLGLKFKRLRKIHWLVAFGDEATPTETSCHPEASLWVWPQLGNPLAWYVQLKFKVAAADRLILGIASSPAHCDILPPRRFPVSQSGNSLAWYDVWLKFKEGAAAILDFVMTSSTRHWDPSTP